MAVVVLFSTMSFTVDMHFCGDTLVETAIFQNAEGCGMEIENLSTENCSIIEKNCCSDEQLLVEGQDELQFSIDKISLEQQLFIASFVHTYIHLFEGNEKETVVFEAYKPPLVVQPIYKLDETYLI